DDILKAADDTPQTPTDNRIIYWITGRWGIGLVTAASVALAFLTGAIVTKGQFEGPPGGTITGSPGTAPRGFVHLQEEQAANPTLKEFSELPPADVGLYQSIVRQGSLQLRGDDPADVQRRVTELVTSSGGMVTSLTRQGTGDSMSVSVSVAVPADKYREFKAKVAGYGEVLNETESTEDVASDQVDLSSRLAEAEDYLARLDKLIDTPNDLSALQNLEHERRQTRLEIERYRRALQSLENRVSLSRLDITVSSSAPTVVVPQGQFTKAWNDGIEGLTEVSAFLLKAGLAGSPFLAMGAIAFIALRRKRKKLEAQDRIAA
ncbi:MAG: DUF4349 domain-containing protein, partial [Planctomycetes bacterium]|nr:DUF4349 domain-containing protein [Planctomycetota bacterium]